MKRLVFLLLCICTIQSSFAQDWKKNALQFVILQDDDNTAIANISVPKDATPDAAGKYALYEKGKSLLTINYELDDDPNLHLKKPAMDNNVDLLKYSNEVADKIVAGTTDITITNRIVANKVQTINGFQTVMVTYDYKHVISGQNITETGKVVMYMIKVTGTSMTNAEEHSFIIRLKFDYQQNGGEDLSKLGKEIINTIKKG
jgi:hypothetical protein